MRRPVSASLLVALLLAVCCACTAAPGFSDPLPAAPSTAAPPPPTATPTPRPTGPASTVAVLGDSLSRGFNACDHYGDCPAVSWAGGRDARIDSVADRLAAQTDGPVQVHNFAKSGALVSDLDRQVTLALATKPDLVTLLIGANDVCRSTLDEMTPTADYAAAVNGALQRIALADPDTTILVASVPDVPGLVAVAGGDATAQFLWSHAGGCATALADPQSSSYDAVDRREAVDRRLDEYDTVLAGSCVALPHCVYDEGALHGYTPTLDQLSALDRFHPSVSGLQELARLEWRALVASDRAVPLLERTE
jgi:lysophospholipase L1-like esterase